MAYGPAGEEVGDLYTPAGPAGAKPAVVLIHGGGWISGSRNTVGKLGALLASAGVVVFNIDYRLAKAGQPDTRWPAQIVDAQLAVRFLRSQAAALEIDPARIGAMGDSAGAQLATLLGAMHSVVPAPQDRLFATEKPDVCVVVDQFGPTDIPGLGADAIPNMTLLFGTATPDRAAVDSASPIGFVTAETAPTYIIHGRLDQIVPFRQSEALDAALQAHKVAHAFVGFEGGHEYEGLDPEDVGKLQIAAFEWLLRWLH